MSLSTDRDDPECVEYHNWLLHIQDQQLCEELLDIVSIISNIFYNFQKNFLWRMFYRKFSKFSSVPTILPSFFQGFKWVLYTRVEVAHITAACENRLLVNKVIERPFTAEEIRGGAFWFNILPWMTTGPPSR